MDAIIFDIDGTLSDLSERRHFVTGGKKDWGAFFAAMGEDKPTEVTWLADILTVAKESWNEYGAGIEFAIFICSGRPEDYREVTQQWLGKHVPHLLAMATSLLMRKSGDQRADTIVKKEMLDSIRGQGYNVRLVVDDRPSVVAMWKSEGITVLEHDSGEWDTIRNWPTGELHMMVGPSGAGKTSYIMNNWEGSAGSILSSDALRTELTGDFADQSKNDQVFKVLHALTRARVKGGLKVMVDATNLRAADRRALRDCCDKDTPIHYYVIDRPLDVKHRCAGWRDAVVIKGVKLIDKHHQSFQSGLKAILDGDGDSRVIVHDYREV